MSVDWDSQLKTGVCVPFDRWYSVGWFCAWKGVSGGACLTELRVDLKFGFDRRLVTVGRDDAVSSISLVSVLEWGISFSRVNSS